MKKLIILAALFIAGFTSLHAQFYNESGAETYISGGDMSINTITFETARAATPGYFSATGTDKYIDASDTWNINGYQKHYANAANQAYTFVVGSGTDLRELSIGGTIPAASVVATAWIAGDPSTALDPTDNTTATAHDVTQFGTGILGVSKAGQWDWIAENTGGATVTVSIPDMSGFALASNLRLVGWDGSKWIDLSNGATAPTENTENTLLTGTIPATGTIYAIGVGSTASPLPAYFGPISAVLRNGMLLIDWSTVFEQNNNRFIIELSRDGQNFFAIDSVKTQATDGNSTAIIKYHYEKALAQVTNMGMSLWVAAILFTLLIAMAVGGRHRIKPGILAAFTAMILIGGISCSKTPDNAELKTTGGNYFVKITQVDIDGTRVSSKIVKVVNE